MTALEVSQIVFSIIVLGLAASIVAKTDGLLHDAAALNVAMATITILTNALLIYMLKSYLPNKKTTSTAITAILKTLTILLAILWFAAFVTIFIAGAKSGDGSFSFGPDEDDYRGDYQKSDADDGSRVSKAIWQGYHSVSGGGRPNWRTYATPTFSSSADGYGTTSAVGTFVTSTSESASESGIYHSVIDDGTFGLLEEEQEEEEEEEEDTSQEDDDDCASGSWYCKGGSKLKARAIGHFVYTVTRRGLGSLIKGGDDIVKAGGEEAFKQIVGAIKGASFACGAFGILIFILSCAEAQRAWTTDWGLSVRDAEEKSLITEGEQARGVEGDMGVGNTGNSRYA